MKRQYVIRAIQISWIIVFMLFVAGLFVPPVQASDLIVQRSNQRQASTNIAAIVYLTKSTIEPLFQASLDQQVPTQFKGTINSMPGLTQGWTSQIAQALIKPSAQLTQLTTQANGLDATVTISLFPQDPKPITAHALITFSVLNSTTIQINGQPESGSPVLINGPIETLKIPLGQITSINTTPTCGDCALALHLLLPVGIGQSQNTGQQSAYRGKTANLPLAYQSSGDITQTNQKNDALKEKAEKKVTQQTINAYIEIPATSIATLGKNIGTLTIDQNLTANVTQLTVQGSNLVATSDIMGSLLGAPVKLGTATTVMQPSVQNYHLIFNVQKTTLTVLSIFTFSADSYNQAIEKTINTELANTFQNAFTPAAVSIGASSNVPCAANNSMLLAGTITLS